MTLKGFLWPNFEKSAFCYMFNCRKRLILLITYSLKFPEKIRINLLQTTRVLRCRIIDNPLCCAFHRYTWYSLKLMTKISCFSFWVFQSSYKLSLQHQIVILIYAFICISRTWHARVDNWIYIILHVVVPMMLCYNCHYYPSKPHLVWFEIINYYV